MLQTISPIRDIVHDYVSPSIFEAEVVDSTYFQRLHFVWQNSAVFTVYPCNKNSRFVHSLGVSHLCGRILIHSLRNSSSEVFKNFLVAADDFVNHFKSGLGTASEGKKLDESWRRAVGNRSRFRHNDLSFAQIQQFADIPESRTKGIVKNDPEFTINTLWIALKIAALCHDIGHLPMSHEFEYAVSDLADTASLFYPNSNSANEQLGEKLSLLVAPDWKQCFATRGAIEPTSTLDLYSNLLGIDQEKLKNYLVSLNLHERRSIRIIDEIRLTEGYLEKCIKEMPSVDEELKKINFDNYRTLLFRIATAILLFRRGKLDRHSDALAANRNHGKFLRALKDILASQLDADRLDYVARDPKVSGLETGVFDLNRIVNSFSLAEQDGQFVAVPSERALTAIEAFFHQRYLNYKSLIYHKSALRSKAVLRQEVMRIVAFSIECPTHDIAKFCISSGVLAEDEDSGDIVEILPFNHENLEQFDDARLRSLFFDVLNVARKPQSKRYLNDAQKYVLLEIELLVETFLFRKKSNLISLDYPYEKFCAELRRYPKLKIADTFKSISTEVDSKYKGRIVCLISKRDPKIYDPENEDAGGQLFIMNKQSGLVPVEQRSPYLNFQRNMVHGEARFILGFCGRALRGDDVLQADLREIARNRLDLLFASQVNVQKQEDEQKQEE